jgi:hypothetical protein
LTRPLNGQADQSAVLLQSLVPNLNQYEAPSNNGLKSFSHPSAAEMLYCVFTGMTVTKIKWHISPKKCTTFLSQIILIALSKTNRCLPNKRKQQEKDGNNRENIHQGIED